MEGTFELLGPIELLQLISQAGGSGVFRVPGGEVFLEKGLPVHAQYKGRTGREGLFQILALKEGRFRYLAGERASRSSLEGPLENYLLEAIRFIDAHLDLSPFDQIEFTDPARTSHLTLSPDEFELLRHLRHPLSLIDLTAKSGLPSETVILNVSHLARLSLVRVTSRIPHTVRLTVERLEGEGETARLDTQLLRAWRNHYGPFQELEVRAAQHSVRIPIAPQAGAEARLLLPTDLLFFYNLRVGEEVLVWPAL
ncbi:DUF4388 domain-containing protein [Meiothermus granaticius]|uniref:PatA-like N-terminal domain-containing protein n=1 Tax=Meiothermus granaticius NBRC 107808 TaxID=1227551 RepID=A0A399F651_9DEIN|nr:DUF4388 domain-containing protein [Meiothermus granaticius]RIH92134.1 hypothetical protein Mgrana_01913 [Meiothermus granaticius NBRC 107808]GEM86537.1 hypothetical protein MGR01S_11620 [Meiothermus granaticius NBRC 107808]